MISRENASTIAEAAARLLAKIDTMTSEEFSQGGERSEREALRAALVKAKIISEDHAARSAKHVAR